MSPEQARGYKDIDYRSDLWSLGVCLYKMLSGRTPHDDTEELGELIVLICTEPPQPIQDLAPWVAPEIAAVVHRALRFSPAERYAGAGEMLAALHGLLRGANLQIDESMLRPLSDGEKAYVAPRLQADLTDAPPPRKGVQTTGSGMTLLPNIPAPAPSYPQAAQSSNPPYAGAGAPLNAPYPQNPGLTDGSFGQSTLSSGAPPRSAAPWIAVAAIVVVLIGGLAVAQITGVFKPSGTATPTGSDTAATADKPRSVTVVILPATAKVEVDGTPAALTEGLLEITGAVGSVHKVRVQLGDIDKTVRVVVSESGAVPPKIELTGATPAVTTTSTTPGQTGPKTKPKPSTAPSTDPLRDKR
jgi:serine/threonine-protein kinase